MQPIELMYAYLRGERLEAVFFIIPIGVALLAFAAVAIRVERPAFAWGVAIPCILFGLVALGTGATVASRTSGQIETLEQQLATDPAAMAEQELPRMRKVDDAFELYVKGYLVLCLLGLAFRFGLRADWAHGAGPALILIAALGLLIDGFAQRRARPYTAMLERLSGGNP